VNNAIGFILTLAAGTSVGVSMWPLKWARFWKWENFWLVYAIFSLIIMPFGLAFSVLPHMGHVYASLTFQQVLLPFGLGVLWGFAQLGAGICVHRLGLAVAGAVLNGTGAAFGTIIPLVSLHREMLFQSNSLLILAGICMMLFGAGFCGWSGYLREMEAKQKGIGAGFAQKEAAMRQASFSSSAYLLTIGIAIGSGVLASLLNIALAYGGDIMKLAESEGGQAAWTPFAVWPIALLGGAIVNIAYAAHLLTKNKSWGNFNRGLMEIVNPVISAALWMAGIAIYSSGTTFLGSLGVSIGFAVFMIMVIVSGQAAGLFTGEWNQMKPETYRPFVAGIGLLVAAVLTIALSRYFES
jgi:L-rhamnose-H+ transport protein